MLPLRLSYLNRNYKECYPCHGAETTLAIIYFLGKFRVTLFTGILGYIVQNIKLRKLPRPVNMNQQIGEGSGGGRPIPNYWRQKENSKGILTPARLHGFFPATLSVKHTVTRGCKINPRENSALNLVCKAFPSSSLLASQCCKEVTDTKQC